MNSFDIVLICLFIIACVLTGLDIFIRVQKKAHMAGTLVVDESGGDPDNGVEVYLQIKTDPHLYEDGDLIQLKIMKVKHQIGLRKER